MTAPTADHVSARWAHLEDQCATPLVSNAVRLDTYYRLAEQCYLQAQSYLRAKDFEIALGLYGIRKHNAFTMAQYSRNKFWLEESLAAALEVLKSIKDTLNNQFAAEADAAAFASVLPQAPASSSRDVYSAVTAAPSAPPYAPPTTVASSSVGCSADGVSLTSLYAKLGFASAPSTAPSSLPSSGAASSTYIASRPPSSATPATSSTSFKTPLPSSSSTSYPCTSTLSRESVDRSAGGSRFRDSGGLRAMQIPADVMSLFLDIAAPNTSKPPRGIETCGILAGVLSPAGDLCVSTLIIPKQSGGPDSCAMTHEEELYEHCLTHGLLTLGWIHTHPSQDCFMSSLDQHTHCGYQAMLPEAVAIVMAPRDAAKPYGIFQLTVPEGLDLIQRCPSTGFHVHPDTHNKRPIYDGCTHVRVEPAGSVDVLDLRLV